MEPVALETQPVTLQLVPPGRVPEAARLATSAWDVAPPPGLVEERMRLPNARVLVATLGGPHGPIVAVTTARIRPDGEADSDETVVAPNYQSLGLGARLITAMADLLRAERVHALRGESSGRRLRALRFFLRNGFRLTGVIRAKDHESFADGELVYLTRMPLARKPRRVRHH